MTSFSNDADILKYEPVLFGELHLPWQILSCGTGGLLSGTIFTDTSADFVSAQVAERGAIYLRSADGSLDGTYEIVSVDSAKYGRAHYAVLALAYDRGQRPQLGRSHLSVSQFQPSGIEVP